MEQIKNIYTKQTPVEAAKTFAAENKMTETEWSNFNNWLEGKDYDDQALLKTFSNVKAVVPSLCLGGGTIRGSIFVPNEPTLACNDFEVCKKTLYNHAYYNVFNEQDERLPYDAEELFIWTRDMFKAYNPNMELTIYINQENDKFMCLTRAWYKMMIN